MKQQALMVALALGATAAPVQGQAQLAMQRPTIVLVHGGFVDGSGWEGVFKRLRKNGYTVTIVQNPTTSLSDDVAATRRAIASSSGPVILVGHSSGGVVIMEAGNDPKVVGLVYIAAFAADKGESVAKLIQNPAPGAPVPPILPPQDGFLFLDKGEVRRFVRGGCRCAARGVHGPIAGALGPQRAQRRGDGSVVADQAELGPRRDGRSDDSTGRSAFHVQAGGLDGARGAWQARGLCVSACP